MTSRRFKLRFRYKAFLIICIMCLLPSTLASTRTIRVGVYNNPPKVIIDSTGRASGIFIELLESIAKKEKWDLKYVHGTWKQSLYRLTTDSIDLMPDVALSTERTANYQFNQITVLSSWLQLFCRKDIQIRSLADLNGKAIAVIEGSVQQEVLHHAREQFSLNFNEIALSEIEQLNNLVITGKADAMLASRFFGYNKKEDEMLVASPLILYPTTLHFATNREHNLDLLNTIDNNLAEMLKEPQSAYYKTLSKWLHENPRTFIPRIVIYIIIVTFSALLFFFSLSFFLKWKVTQRTTELARKNEELSVALDELKIAKDEAVKRERLHAFGQLSCGIAHDFNNLLTPILSYSDMLLCDLKILSNEETSKEYLLHIHNAALHGRDIVQRLQDFYRSARNPELKETINVNQIITEVVDLAKIRWTHHTTEQDLSQIEVVFDFADEVFITGKKSEIHEVLLNLVLNAADAMPKGGTLYITTKFTSNLEIIIKDNGIGMPEDVVAKCTQPFFTTKGEKGTGMGLTMVQNVIKELNGSIEIKSQPGEGTEIKLLFPQPASSGA